MKPCYSALAGGMWTEEEASGSRALLPVAGEALQALSCVVLRARCRLLGDFGDFRRAVQAEGACRRCRCRDSRIAAC